jgi:tripartite-type tricarboxylate transporter receptor subunit TctC
VRDRLEQALFKVVALPPFKERFASTGMHGTLGSADFKTRLAREFPYWQAMVKKLGIQAE